MKRVSLVFWIILCLSCKENTPPAQSHAEESERSIAPKQSLIRGERIDGPANIRDRKKGKIMMSISDNVLVDCGKLKKDWFQISLRVPITESQANEGIIKKGASVYDEDNTLILEAKMDLELLLIDEFEGQNYGLLEGYTHVNNIKAHTIPEKALEKILASGEKLSFSLFESYLKEFEFEESGFTVKGYEELEQYMIYGAWIEDPSPIDRIRLMFREKELFAIIHEREINMDGKVSYPIARDMNFMPIQELDKSEIKELKTRKYNPEVCWL